MHCIMDYDPEIIIEDIVRGRVRNPLEDLTEDVLDTLSFVH